MNLVFDHQIDHLRVMLMLQEIGTAVLFPFSRKTTCLGIFSWIVLVT